MEPRDLLCVQSGQWLTRLRFGQRHCFASAEQERGEHAACNDYLTDDGDDHAP
jgi:hypothetical protein